MREAAGWLQATDHEGADEGDGAPEGAAPLRVALHHGKGRANTPESFIQTVSEHDIVLTSYNLLQRDEELMQEVTFDGVVLDEAQNIKNPTTRQSKVARTLKGHFRLALTGTPLENRPLDLWSIMDFLNEGLLGSRTQFTQTLEHPIVKQRRQGSMSALARLVRARTGKGDQGPRGSMAEEQVPGAIDRVARQSGAAVREAVELAPAALPVGAPVSPAMVLGQQGQRPLPSALLEPGGDHRLAGLVQGPARVAQPDAGGANGVPLGRVQPCDGRSDALPQCGEVPLPGVECGGVHGPMVASASP